MSSATSTSESASAVRLPSADNTVPAHPSVFRASHFFILASLIAATGAVIMSRQSTPEHLVLISATIAAAGLAAAGFYRVLSPLVGDAAVSASEPLSQRARAVIEREKALALRSLKELEFDRSMGKVSQADCDLMAARLRARALTLMKQLDEDGTGYRSMIERELQSRLSARTSEGKPEADTATKEPVTVAAAAVPAARACACGTDNDPDALFCKRCGNRLTPAVSAPQ